MVFSDFLTKADLEKIKNYRYTASGFTFIEILFFEPFWNLITSMLPRKLAPNMITLSGFIFPLVLGVYQLRQDLTLTKEMDSTFFFLLAWALFWFQTCDAVDGKQARRTDNCSPMGQILDHSLDQVSYIFFYLGTVQAFRCGPGLMMWGMLYAGLAPHYTIEFRKYFTNHHSTVLGVLGATEDLTIKYIYVAVVAFKGHAWFFCDLGFIHPALEGAQNWWAIALFAAISGAIYCFGNIWVGLRAAKCKKEALVLL